MANSPLVATGDRVAHPGTTRNEGAWGERRYSSYSFSILELDGVSGQRHASAAL
jgi:hypothetical protein